MANLFNSLRWRRRRRLEEDLTRELRYHVDRAVDDLTKRGLSEADARRRVALDLGGIPQVQENVRDTWMARWLDTLVRDTRFAIRSLSRSWAFTLGAGAMLALGIGANTAIFSVVNAVLLRPLAYPDADRIVSIETLWTRTRSISPDVSGPDFLDWQSQNRVFEMMAHSSGEDDVATVVGGYAEFANFRSVSPDFFAVFGLPPSAGRLLTHDASGDADAVAVVVSHPWAVTHFGSAQAAVGRPVKVFDQPVQIVGVAAPGFDFPGRTDIWVRGTTSTNRGNDNYQVIGRLKPGIDLAHARIEMRGIGDRLAQAYPDNRLKTVAVTPLQERLTGSVRKTLWVLMGAVGLVLLIACANIANLLVARAAGRTREIALRAALGAGRGRVARQLLTESFVLVAVGTLAGLAVAFILVRALTAMSPPGLPRVQEIGLDPTVLLFALGLSVISTLLAGLLPAIHASRLELSDALKQGGTKGSSSRGGRLRASLVVSEVALSVVLLTASGLLLRSFQKLHHVDLGYSTERVFLAQTQYAAAGAEARLHRIAFYRDLVKRVRAVPGVAAAAGVSILPLGKETTTAIDYFVHGRPEGRPGERPTTSYRAVTPGYFATLRIPIRRGRDFEDTDTTDRPLVAIINETLARTAFPNESPLGKQIRSARGPQWLEIVGVSADTRWSDPSQPPPAELFAAAGQGAGSLSLLVRTSLDDRSVASVLRALLHEVNPTVPVAFEALDALFAESLAYPRFRTQLIGAFGAMAALLAAVGVFSVLAYLVGQRTKELAIRRAIGATATDIVHLIAGHGLRLVAIGLVLGVAGALAVAGLLEGLLYQVSPWDLAAYFGATGVLGTTAMFATVLPAMRAATVDPLIALRQD